MKHGYCLALALLAPSVGLADKSFVVSPDVPACRARTPAAIGGPMPPEGILAIRWLG